MRSQRATTRLLAGCAVYTACGGLVAAAHPLACGRRQRACSGRDCEGRVRGGEALPDLRLARDDRGFADGWGVACFDLAGVDDRFVACGVGGSVRVSV